jgi:argininosuccinate lyase
MLTIMHNTPFTDMNDSEGESQGFGYGAFESGGRVLDLLAALVPALRINPDRVRQNIRRSCITVTELADSLVRREGLSFREAHEIAAEVSRAVVAVEGDIATEGYGAFQEAFERCAKRQTAIDRAQFAEIVSPDNFVAVRDRFGGPAPRALSQAIAGYNQEISGIRSRMQEAARRAETSAQDLQSRFTALLGAR